MTQHNGGLSEDTIVVGVDGSEASKEALRWAARQAELTGCSVRAVMAWEYPAMYGWGPTTPPEDLEGLAHQALTEAIDAALGPGRTVRVEENVVLGSPSHVLLDAVRHGQTLVVGSRGRGGFATTLLGSVSQHCAQHATGPIVIVRALSA